MADVVWFTGHQFFDSDGEPLNGGLIRIYDATTTSERTVYKDDGAATPWTQPITLNASGRLTAAIYVPEGDWKFTRTNSAGGDSITEDNIPGAVAAASAAFAAPLRPILTKAANYVLTSSDLGKLVVGDASGGAFTLTLPSAADTASGKGYDVIQIGTVGAVTIATVSAQTINGSSTFILRPQYGTVRITSDGSNWVAEPFDYQKASPTAKVAAYTVKQADEGKLIPVDASGAGITVTLPTVALAANGFRIGIKKTDSSTNAVTVDGDGAETIDGAANYLLNGQYETLWLICNGTTWHIWSAFSGARPLTVGKHTIWVPASAMISATTSGPASASVEAATNDQNYKVLDFDASADEFAHFQVRMPKSWNEGTITYQPVWTSTATDTDGVAWSLEGLATGDSDAIDASWGTAILVTDAAQSVAGDVYIGSESAALTIAGSPAAGELAWFRVSRDVSDAADTHAEDARLIGYALFLTLDAPNDA
jgi:hypothetical protein